MNRPLSRERCEEILALFLEECVLDTFRAKFRREVNRKPITRRFLRPCVELVEAERLASVLEPHPAHTLSCEVVFPDPLPAEQFGTWFDSLPETVGDLRDWESDAIYLVSGRRYARFLLATEYPEAVYLFPPRPGDRDSTGSRRKA